MYNFKYFTPTKVLFGKGTGTLPSFRHYTSFHNSYIQLLVQNGLIALIVLVIILKQIWNEISDECHEDVCLMSIAIFVGIIVYNSFECTLLQNKIFLGICEWIVLCIGLANSRHTLSNANSNRTC